MFANAAVQAVLDGTMRKKYGGYIEISPHKNHPSWVILHATPLCKEDDVDDDVTRACNGLIVDTQTGQIIALPFPRLPEISATEKALLEFPLATEADFDGTLGISYWENDQLKIATRGSFWSMQARDCMKLLRKARNIMQLPRDWTLNFHLVKGTDQEKMLLLLGVMDKKTGEDLPTFYVNSVASLLGVTRPQTVFFANAKELEAVVQTVQNWKGFFVRTANGRRRILTDWYKNQ